jgi:hypothetical protein
MANTVVGHPAGGVGVDHRGGEVGVTLAVQDDGLPVGRAGQERVAAR